VASSFGSFVSPSQQTALSSKLFTIMQHTFDKTTVMDSADQMHAVAASSASIIMDFFCSLESSDDNSASCPSLTLISEFRSHISTKATTFHENLRNSFLSGAAGHAPASPYLGRTKRLYEFVREGSLMVLVWMKYLLVKIYPRFMRFVADLSQLLPTYLADPCPFRLFAMVKCRMLSFRCLFEHWLST